MAPLQRIRGMFSYSICVSERSGESKRFKSTALNSVLSIYVEYFSHSSLVSLAVDMFHSNVFFVCVRECSVECTEQTVTLCFTLLDICISIGSYVWVCVWDMAISSNSFACFLIDYFSTKLQRSDRIRIKLTKSSEKNIWKLMKIPTIESCLSVSRSRVTQIGVFVWPILECYYCQ